MLTVILMDNGEANVVAMTYEDVEKQLASIPSTELVVTSNPLRALTKVTTPLVCFLEADCLLSAKYFSYLINHVRQDKSRRITVDSSVTAVSRWDNKFYGYTTETIIFGNQEWPVASPQKEFKSHSPYPVQMAYIPGALIRLNSLQKAIEEIGFDTSDLVKLSVDLSLYFWRNNGRVYLNPKVTYVTTEEYVGLNSKFDPMAEDLLKIFEGQSI